MSPAPVSAAEPTALRVARDWRRPSAPGGWTLHWREGEGYGQLHPRPSPEEAAAAHAVEDYYTHGGPAPEPARPTALQRLLLHLAWRADQSAEADAGWWAARLGPRPLRILEIGCGSGETLALLAGQGHRVEGIEPDPSARARALARGLAVHPGTAEDLPPLAAPYDAVLLLHVLEHCLDPARALANLVALLAPGGLAVVEVPNNACRGRAVFGASWLWLDVPRHLNFFTPRSLAAALRAAGLAPERTDYAGYCRQFSAGWAADQARVAAALGDARGRQPWRYPLLLALTALAAPERKYDSVRISARRAAGPAAAPGAASG